MLTLTSHAAVCAVFVDPTCGVPPARSDGSVGTLNWLRDNVCRFSNGAEHQRRRALVEAELEQIDTGWLRAAARDRARSELTRVGDEALDVLARVAKPQPVGVLTSALGVSDIEPVVESTIVVAAVYLRGPSSADVDAHVQRLLGLLGPEATEAAANRIGILVQACNATAALIDSALRLSRLCGEDWPVEALIAETLRYDPPARSTQRACQSCGQVTLDLAAANRDPAVFEDADRFDPSRPPGGNLGFGYGPRSCPGQEQATALASGVLEAILP